MVSGRSWACFLAMFLTLMFIEGESFAAINLDDPSEVSKVIGYQEKLGEYTVLDALKSGLLHYSSSVAEAKHYIQEQNRAITDVFFNHFMPRIRFEASFITNVSFYKAVDSDGIERPENLVESMYPNLSVRFEQTLFDFFVGATRLEAAEFGLLAGEFGYQSAKEKQIREILIAYYDVVYARQHFALMKGYEKKMREIFKICEYLISARLATEMDLQAAKIGFLKSMDAVTESVTQLKSNEEKFFNVVGKMPPYEMYTIAFDNIFPDISVDDFVALVLKRNTSLQQRRCIKQQGHKNLIAAKLDLLPKFSLSWNNNVIPAEHKKEKGWITETASSAHAYTASLMLSFDVLSKYPALNSAQNSFEQQSDALRKSHHEVYIYASQIFHAFQAYKDEYQRKNDLKNAYFDLLRASMEQYRIAKISIEEMVKAQNDFIRGKKDLMDADRNRFKNFVEVISLIGYYNVNFNDMIGELLIPEDVIKEIFEI